jgi:hypothetical protein
MAMNVRHARFEGVVVRTPNLQRPGRRTFSLAFGLASMLVAVDAIFHPGSPAGLWTVQTLQDLTALVLDPFATVAGLLAGTAVVPWWVSIVALGLAAIAGGGYRRLIRSRTSAAAETEERAGQITPRFVPCQVVGRDGDPTAPVPLRRQPPQHSHPTNIPCRAA